MAMKKNLQKLLGWLVFGLGFAVVGFLALSTAIQGFMSLPPLGLADLQNRWMSWPYTVVVICVGATVGLSMVGGYVIAVQQLMRRQAKLLLAEFAAGVVLACSSILYKFDRYWSCPAHDSASMVGLGWPLPMIKLSGPCDFEAYFYVGMNVLFWSAFAASAYYLYKQYRE